MPPTEQEMFQIRDYTQNGNYFDLIWKFEFPNGYELGPLRVQLSIDKVAAKGYILPETKGSIK